MASVQKITGKNGETWKCSVRIKGHPPKIKCFDDYETAVIWGKYHEMITREKDNFAVKEGDMFTVLDVMVSKYGHNTREMNDCHVHFQNIDIWHTYVNRLDYETLMRHTKTLLETPIFRGGAKGNETGIKKYPEPMTILRKWAYLSSAINDLVKKGANIENHTTKVIAWLREQAKEKKNGCTREGD